MSYTPPSLTGNVIGNSDTGAVSTTIATSVALAGSPTTTTQSSSDNSTKIATTAYVTTAVANAIAGVNPAVAVQAATAAVLPNSPTYTSVAAGVGDTLTSSTNSVLVVDGYTANLNDRILVKNQSSAYQNGIYSVTQLGVASVTPWIMTRATDYDQPSDVNNTGAIPVVNGTANASTSWVLTSQITSIGPSGSSFTYTQFSLNPTTILTNTLTSGDIFVGNGSNVATGVALSGDATLSNSGALTLDTVNSNVGSYVSANITVNGKGLITAASNGGINFTANTETSSFNAVAGNAYFVTATSGTVTCTLPTAVGVGGQEIIVFLTGSGATLTLNTTSSQTISGQASGAISTTIQYNGYRVISDNSNWQLE